jgi:hypothetical protein
MTTAHNEPPTLAELLGDYRATLATRAAAGAAKRLTLAARDEKAKAANAKRGLSWAGRLYALLAENPSRRISHAEIEAYGEIVEDEGKTL